MKPASYILLLRVTLAQAPGRPRWSRKALQGTFLAVTSLSLLALWNYAWYLPSEGGTLEDELDLPDFALDTVYLPFQPAPSSESTLEPLKPTLPLPRHCLDAHLTYGEACFNSNMPSLDVVWTWVNGSDILLQDAKARISSSYSEDNPYRPSKSWKTARQFRDHDELRHSIRSVLAHFRAHAGNFHILASDFRIPPQALENVTQEKPFYRLGQVPQWLDVEQTPRIWSDGEVELTITHHADFIQPYHDTVFNSYAIESQFGHLKGISENFIYMNDDFFLTNPVTEKTFYTSPYGLVFRMQSDLLVAPSQYANNVHGEWRNLAASNVLLGNRFGSRSRPYVAHEAKSVSIAMLHEIIQMWPKRMAETATHPFRETARGESDPSTMYLMVHFVVERWREALLWSWVIGKHGRLDDGWGQEEADAAWKELGGMIGAQSVYISEIQRESLNPERIKRHLALAGFRNDDPTKYVFTSQDGYPYVNFLPNGANKWPKFDPGAEMTPREVPRCSINYNECFTEHDVLFANATGFFKNIAFKHPQCGDCVILALLKQSGELGLSSFLPDRSRSVADLNLPAPDQEVTRLPHLPLVERWEDGAFSLRDVLASSSESNVRSWTLQLLQRYRFVIGETPSHFAMIANPSDATVMFRKLSREPDVALLCVNDDIALGHESVSNLLLKFQEDRWPVPAAWEVRGS